MEGVGKRVRDESEAEQPEAKRRLRCDVFDALEDDFGAADEPVEEVLATLMESFEREIGAADEGVKELGDVQTAEIGWLLEASDDELGLPPSTSGEGNEGGQKFDLPPHAAAETVGDGWGFEPWELGCGVGDSGGEWLGFDGLLDNEDVEFGFGGYS